MNQINQMNSLTYANHYNHFSQMHMMNPSHQCNQMNQWNHFYLPTQQNPLSCLLFTQAFLRNLLRLKSQSFLKPQVRNPHSAMYSPRSFVPSDHSFNTPQLFSTNTRYLLFIKSITSVVRLDCGQNDTLQLLLIQ